jgi:glucose/arabinose dehydrogenase
METAPFVDQDAGDEHYCTDWEIWRLDDKDPSHRVERVWAASCVFAHSRTHIHQADGNFLGSRAERGFLDSEAPHLLRARHRDTTGVWGRWGERRFETGDVASIRALELRGVEQQPAPVWRTTDGNTVQPVTAQLMVKPADGGNSLVTFRAGGIEVGPALGEATPIRVRLRTGSNGISLPETQVEITSVDGEVHTLYLPAATLSRNTTVDVWISTNGSSFQALPIHDEPRFDMMLRYTPRPWKLEQPGLGLEVFTSGLRMPVDIVFPPDPGPRPQDLFFYASEFYGAIKVVRRNGQVATFASNLLNFDPTANFPGTGEVGISTLLIEPVSGDIFLSLTYAWQDGVPTAGLSGRVIRMRSLDDGFRAGTKTTIFDTYPETFSPSHIISRIHIGPDGALYVHVGDSFEPETAYDLNSYRGKILRMDLDGQPLGDNPFYDASDGINARDYIYAYGFRNPFGGAFRPLDGALYAVENGPQVDRLAKIRPGLGYGWDSDGDGVGTNADMSTLATYNWTPPPRAPVNLIFLHRGRFNGSGFPAERMGRAYVAEFGQAFAPGPIVGGGKRLEEFLLSADGLSVTEEPRTVVVYDGHARSTLAALAAGPDGIYFAEFFVDDPANFDPAKRGARVWRLYATEP